jgi:hypothetical protein
MEPPHAQGRLDRQRRAHEKIARTISQAAYCKMGVSAGMNGAAMRL